jgi:TolA-binding protein
MARAVLALFAAALIALAPLPGAAQQGDPARAQTLAEIRAELAALSSELADLRSEFIASDLAAQPTGGTMLDRILTLEAELVRLTGASEAFDLRLRRIVDDLGLRLGDLEFRLTELEGGDVGALGPAAPLGGAQPDAAAAAPVTAPSADPSAVPSADTSADPAADAAERAGALIDGGDPAGALALLDAAIAAAPSDPAIGELDLLRGEALYALGQRIDAAQAFLDSVSGAPEAPWAATAMLRLGATLGEIGEMVDACIALAEVGLRYPGDVEAVDEAERLRAAFACP